MKKILTFLLLALAFSTTSAQDTIQLENTTLVTTTLADNLTIPWDLHWGPDGWIWFNERDGDIFRLHPDSLTLEKIYTISDVYQSVDNSGAHAFALHPNFPFKPYAYVHYTHSLFRSKLVRLTYSINLKTFVQSDELITDILANETHNGSRIIFDTNNLLYLSIGDGYSNNVVNDISYTVGKINRCTDNGQIPESNPFPNSYTYSYGHRNPQGLVFGANGILYSSEHGEATDDELNIIEKGRGYGWPFVEGFCDSPSELEACDSMNVHEPLMIWTPTYAPGGLAYFDHPSIPEWKNCLLQAFLKQKLLTVIPLSEDGKSIVDNQRWEYLVERYGRLRDVMVAPNGRIFIATSNQETNGQWVTPDNYDKIIEIKNPNYDYPSGLQAPIDSKLSVFPNPTSNRAFWINLSSQERELEVSITDFGGNVVLTKTVSSLYPGLWYIEADQLSSGVYVVTYSTERESGQHKVVISN